MTKYSVEHENELLKTGGAAIYLGKRVHTIVMRDTYNDDNSFLQAVKKTAEWVSENYPFRGKVRVGPYSLLTPHIVNTLEEV